MKIACDAYCGEGGGRFCPLSIAFTCGCRRCGSEPEDSERFHACAHHRAEAGQRHQRIRERAAVWVIASPRT